MRPSIRPRQIRIGVQNDPLRRFAFGAALKSATLGDHIQVRRTESEVVLSVVCDDGFVPLNVSHIRAKIPHRFRRKFLRPKNPAQKQNRSPLIMQGEKMHSGRRSVQKNKAHTDLADEPSLGSCSGRLRTGQTAFALFHASQCREQFVRTSIVQMCNLRESLGFAQTLKIFPTYPTSGRSGLLAPHKAARSHALSHNGRQNFYRRRRSLLLFHVDLLPYLAPIPFSGATMKKRTKFA